MHDHPTVYTLTVDGQPTSAPAPALVLIDYLPASLEFLGCGGVDNSSAPGVRRRTVADRDARRRRLPDARRRCRPCRTRRRRADDLPARASTPGSSGPSAPSPAGGRSRVTLRRRASRCAPTRLWPGRRPEPDRPDPDRQPGQQHRAVHARDGDRRRRRPTSPRSPGTYEGPVAPGGTTQRPGRRRADRSASRTSGCASRSTPDDVHRRRRRDLHADRRHLASTRSADLHVITDIMPDRRVPARRTGHQLRHRRTRRLRGRQRGHRAVGALRLGDAERRTAPSPWSSPRSRRRATAPPTITYQGAMLPTYIGGPLAGEPTTHG